MAQQQSTVTISGYVGAEPVSFGRNENFPACSLRIASTQSYYRNDEHQWHDRPTTWMTVKAYRTLASNVLKSVHKGDAIMVYGNLSTESWTKDGNDYNRLILEACAIGHDLNRGTTQFTKRTNQSDTNNQTEKSAQTEENTRSEKSAQTEQTNSHSHAMNDEFGGDADI
ncbi:single-stranded DNA-binding protein [Gardnerella vaginalis]|uniref:single-stranded DNA-binding protein n=1 Tax=Gardnerella TaxID=2701 RepID=UPI000353B5BE|nr:single-stranded DNA-binding protein [Gardnerella vaginalis]EPI42501.1 single-strand binding family protein [Gardnerella vaginalis JCP8481A]EPI42716.1 single-strand binding family protein [Gardnerella vaginalis JCP8481B]